MSSGTFKAALSTATAISAAAVKPCATAQRMPGFHTVAPGLATGEPIEPPPSSHLIATAPAEVRIPLILRPEIALKRMAILATKAPAGRSPIEAAEAIDDALFEAADGRSLIELISSGVEPDWGREGVLWYAQRIAEAVIMTPASVLKLAPHDLVQVLHFLAQMSDRFTQHVTIAGVSHRCTSDVANLMRPIFRAAHQQEEALIKAGTMTAETATMLARVLYLYGRKGRYFYALRERAEGWQTGRSELAASILYMTEAAYRFLALGKKAEALRVREVLARIRQEHGISGDPEAWAFVEYGAHLQQRLRLIQEVYRTGGSLPFGFDFARIWYDGLVVGLSNDGPALLGMAEEVSRGEGFDAYAEHFQHWGGVASDSARRLRASIPPPAIRPPAADSDE